MALPRVINNDSEAVWMRLKDKMERATWVIPADIKAVYRNASFLANNRVVFNIKGKHYRLVVLVIYQHGVVYIRFVGTHEEYDRIDAATV